MICKYSSYILLNKEKWKGKNNMNKEYAIYPFRYMNITQRHDEGNHYAHSANVTNRTAK